MQQPAIIDRGRGPEIAGTRITVYNILDYLEEGWHHTQIALFFRISSRQVLAAVEYIDGHRDQVMADYREMLARSARGNPPELQAKLDAAHERFLEMVRKRREAESQEAANEGDSARR